MIEKGLDGRWNNQHLDFVRSPASDVVNAATQLLQGHAYEIEYGQTLHLRGCSNYLFYQLVNSEWTTLELLTCKKINLRHHLNDLIRSMNSQAISFSISDTSGVITYKWFDSEGPLSEFFYESNSFDSSDKMYYEFVNNFLTSKNIYILYASWSSRFRKNEKEEAILDPELCKADFRSIYCVEFD